MIKKRWPWVLAIVLVAIAAYFLGKTMQSEYIPVLYIVGDVGECIKINDINELGDLQSVDYDGKTYRAVTLADVVSAAQPTGQTERVLMIADDGFSVELACDTLKDCWLAFNQTDGWRILAPLHPLSANGTHIWRIVVVGDNKSKSAVTVTAGNQTQSFTVGQLYAGTILSFPYPEGLAEKATDDVVYTSTVYTRRDCLSLEQLGSTGAKTVLISNADDKSLTVNTSVMGLFQLNGNSINYIDARERISFENIKQITVLE